MPLFATWEWNFFAVTMQMVVVITLLCQIGVALKVIFEAHGAECFVRVFAVTTGVLIFLGSRALKVTFADLILVARTDEVMLRFIALGGVVPAVVGIVIAQMTIRALRRGGVKLIRVMLLVGVFSISQVAYTNYVAIAQDEIPLDKAFIPNLCYSIAIGLWLVFNHDGNTPEAEAQHAELQRQRARGY